MSTAAKRKPTPVSIPTLAERTRALAEEILSAPADQRQEAIEAFQGAIDQALDELAERVRPKGPNGIPVGYIRMQFADRSKGPCACKAYLKEALKDA
jgi:hypothetical protein